MPVTERKPPIGKAGTGYWTERERETEQAERARQAALETILGSIDAGCLTVYNENVAKEIRLSGSAEELRAFEYIRDTLEGFGLEPKLEFHDAFISLPGHAELIVGSVAYDAITHAMSASTARLDVPLQYVDAQAIGDHEFNGGAAVVHGLANWTVLDRLQQQGASAAIFINNGTYTHEMIVSAVWGNPASLEDRYPVIPVLSVNRTDGERIKAQLESGNDGIVHAVIQTEVTTGWLPIPTLTAEIRGQAEPEQFILFSGHVDSWHYGAMDNGSANAVMLETARVLSLYRERLRRSVRLAFWSGHSHGRYAGSALYSDLHWEELYENGVLHVNIDSVGAVGAVSLGAANTMAETRSLCADAVRVVTDEPFRGSPFGRAGDQSFWGVGLPSVFMGLSYQPDGWFGWWWHTTEDTLDKLAPAHLVRDCKVYAAAIYHAASAPIVPIDQREAVHALQDRVNAYAKLAGEHLDFGRIELRLRQLDQTVDAFYRLVASVSPGLSEPGLRVANRVVLGLSRILVPLNYVRGSVYGHDPAISQPLVPALADAELLAASTPGSDVYYRLRTGLVREMNRFGHELKRAEHLVAAGMDELEKAEAPAHVGNH